MHVRELSVPHPEGVTTLRLSGPHTWVVQGMDGWMLECIDSNTSSSSSGILRGCITIAWIPEGRRFSSLLCIGG